MDGPRSLRSIECRSYPRYDWRGDWRGVRESKQDVRETPSLVPAGSHRYARSRISQSEGDPTFCLHYCKAQTQDKIYVDMIIAHWHSSHVQEFMDDIFQGEQTLHVMSDGHLHNCSVYGKNSQ